MYWLLVVHYVVFSSFPSYNVCTGVPAPSTYERGIAMKLQKLSRIALKKMVKEYIKTGKDCFDFDYFKNLFPTQSEDYITKALILLDDDGFVSVSPYDGIAYMTILQTDGIVKLQEDTFFKKSLNFCRSVFSLFK